MLNEIMSAAPLAAGRGSSLLHDAWIIDDESKARVHAACVRHVLVLEVVPILEASGEGAYRGAAVGARRVLVDTVDGLRAQYLAQLDVSALAWQPGAPPGWLQERARACLIAAKLPGAQILNWAEEDVAEISWGRAGDKRPSRVDYVGTEPVRPVGRARLGRFGARSSSA